MTLTMKGRWALVGATSLLAQGCALASEGGAPLPLQPPSHYLLDLVDPAGAKGPAAIETRSDPKTETALETNAPRSPAPAEAPASSPATGPWWTAFADPALDALIDEALAHNHTLRDLRGLYHEDMLAPARPNGPLWPLQIGVPVVVERANSVAAVGPGSGAGVVDNIASAAVTASYQVDLFGQLALQRRSFDDFTAIQGQSAEAGAQNIAAQVAQVWFEVLAQRALLDLLQQQVKLNEDLAGLVQDRFEVHLTNHLAVLQQAQQLLNTRAQVPLITARLALLGSELTALLGRPPSPSTALVPADRRLPQLPPAAQVGVPADLVRSSPEVRSAQLRVGEAEHRLRINRASWLPVINLFGDAGWQTFDFKQPLTFDQSSAFVTWAYGVRLTWPIFDGGQRLTEAKQLRLTVKRRNMLYEQAFLEAVRRVQDARIQEAKQADNVRTLQAEVELGTNVLAEARHLFEQGLSDYLAVLTALGNLSDLERALIQARRLQLSYRIQLYRALGGTWSSAIVELKD